MECDEHQINFAVMKSYKSYKKHKNMTKILNGENIRILYYLMTFFITSSNFVEKNPK